MLIIKTDQPNTLVVTVSQNSELTNPEYLFSFTHIFSKQRVTFIPTDISTHKVRYDEFYFVEGNAPGQINFPYQGLYLYAIYEQPSGSGNLDPALATNVVENGEAQVFPASASTMESQYDIYISSNEDNANIIFAPDEPQPGPVVTPSITPSPSVTPSITPTNTVTPSITPTNTTTPTNTPTTTATPTTTPTNTPTPSTPTSINPSTLGALWWIDFTDTATLTIVGTPGNQNVDVALDKIANVPFSADTTGQGPNYFPTGYLSLSGDVRSNARPLSNPFGTYSNVGEYTWFAVVYDDPLQQRGGKIIVGAETPGWPSGQAFHLMIDGNFNPYPPGPVWRFQNRTISGSAVQLTDNITFSNWTFVAMRSYNSGSNCILEVWENGSIIDSGSVIGSNSFVATNPRFDLMFDGGIDFNTEQFFFNRKLDNTEMAQMFSYLTTKY